MTRSASTEEIKHAYRELAGKYHPDKLEHLGDEFKALAEMRFKEIQQAYQELTGKGLIERNLSNWTSMIPCFAAEKTLGRLTKWLRLLGFDTRYESELSGKKFIETLEKDRILLTRTRRIQKQFASRKLIFIESDHLDAAVKSDFPGTGFKSIANTAIFKMSAMQCVDRSCGKDLAAGPGAGLYFRNPRSLSKMS